MAFQSNSRKSFCPRNKQILYSTEGNAKVHFRKHHGNEQVPKSILNKYWITIKKRGKYPKCFNVFTVFILYLCFVFLIRVKYIRNFVVDSEDDEEDNISIARMAQDRIDSINPNMSDVGDDDVLDSAMVVSPVDFIADNNENDNITTEQTEQATENVLTEFEPFEPMPIDSTEGERGERNECVVLLQVWTEPTSARSVPINQNLVWSDQVDNFRRFIENKEYFPDQRNMVDYTDSE